MLARIVSRKVKVVWQCGLYSVVGLLAIGCGATGGPGAAKVRRDVVVTVMYEGTPVIAGQIDFQNAKTGDAGGGQIDASGQATIVGLPVGTYTVAILPPPVVVVPGVNDAEKLPEPPDIPQKYRSMATSPLKAEITGEQYEVAFELDKE